MALISILTYNIKLYNYACSPLLAVLSLPAEFGLVRDIVALAGLDLNGG